MRIHVLSVINWLGYIFAVIATIVLAGLWFALVIAKPYQVARGRNEISVPAPMALVQARRRSAADVQQGAGYP